MDLSFWGRAFCVSCTVLFFLVLRSVLRSAGGGSNEPSFLVVCVFVVVFVCLVHVFFRFGVLFLVGDETMYFGLVLIHG